LSDSREADAESCRVFERYLVAKLEMDTRLGFDVFSKRTIGMIRWVA